ncbi:hypothetical protein PRVXT_000239 [Proteinivorax tanatarense]|uniref:Uncharacterized protein n=1 Tax=Proteinivorax tanatarense TaxID=1260629 RepID=A0AAU7VMZ8_9FIRM
MGAKKTYLKKSNNKNLTLGEVLIVTLFHWFIAGWMYSNSYV